MGETCSAPANRGHINVSEPMFRDTAPSVDAPTLRPVPETCLTQLPRTEVAGGVHVFFVFPDNKNYKTELLFTFAARSSDRAAERDGSCQWSCIWNAMGRHSWHVSKQRAVKSLLWVRHGTHFRTAGLSNLLWLRIFANRLDI